ncbi:MAG: HAMP domain-containing histidine kinase [Thermoanaerobaculales bacterium]|jgi:signal transduction histidine kinase|nr:HAMP domain-containing histidine kinase [Thermoanaerobaculales bacterium]
MARSIALAVVVTLVVSSAGVLVVGFIAGRSSLEAAARRFAVLISGPVIQASYMYGDIGMDSVVKGQIQRLLELNPDIDRVEVIRQSGLLSILATRDAVEVWPIEGRDAPVLPLGLQGAFESRISEAGRVRLDGRTVYRVVVPRGNESRTYGLTLVAIFGYDRLYDQLRRGLLVLTLAVVLGLVVAEWVAASLARSVTKNLERLRQGVRTIHGGRMGLRVEVDSGDEIEELAGAFNDMVGALGSSMERLRQANAELQALDQVKIDLVANVSHELRTPLTALKGFLELLDDGELGKLSVDAARAVGVCRRNVDRLALRVEDLVQLSQMERGWPTARADETVDLGELIGLVTEIYEGRARSKGVQLATEIQDGLPPIVGDEEQLERVVINLLDNAVKFTPTDGRVTVAAEECDHEGREGVLVRVDDTGIGIPPGELVRIFDRFHQVDPSIRRRFGGMGLGLSLVQHIVDSHHGVVWAESQEGSGSTLSVWLPCPSTPAADAVRRGEEL